MSGSNAWAEFAGVFARNRAAYLEHEQAKTELKSLVPQDASKRGKATDEPALAASPFVPRLSR
jgi:hypothetical protein